MKHGRSSVVQDPLPHFDHILPSRPLYIPQANDPMRLVVFASGGGGNLKACLDFSGAFPHLAKVVLVVTDRFGIPAIDIAKEAGIPVISRDFDAECGVWLSCKDNPTVAEQYRSKAERLHDEITEEIISLEKKEKKIDFAVFSYHRWVHGKFLKYFHERIINQHAADVSIFNRDGTRKYIGINPVLAALQDGEKKTRTSTFLVREGHDTGESLCQGPWVTFEGELPVSKESAYEHEVKQKRQSDWPSLKFALRGLSEGKFALAENEAHADGCKVVLYNNVPLAYAGYDINDDNEYEK
ncbi:hypothetical protein COU18_02045 [Candidatus Kaiserbacteria bacterium CG10_big_fil_rev_8_21_14_0_10_51_14]|uniref:phosphoribosylglycinamide formyltransferase 1 n=1 Tax=Candidatus Kaiserbacteria bacterium CG10_big_fil_rev_8_21_14_0_10_51_14 TaxID=1974610 RepID=A0A2H0UBW9_9BACT|nr:MAG: hypothetical protein COU18_02045 [Candidatus Kaiserbacteria bacterium CG10_big_fil_rev_8_21_14_0_10_51_14]